MKCILTDIAFFYVDILTNEKGNESLLSTDLHIKVPSLMVISKFKTYHDHPDVTPQVQTPLDIFHKKTYQSLQKDLPKPPPFTAQRSSMKCFIEWKFRALILSKKLVMRCILFHRNTKKGLSKKVLCQFPLECQLPVSLSHFQR